MLSRCVAEDEPRQFGWAQCTSAPGKAAAAGWEHGQRQQQAALVQQSARLVQVATADDTIAAPGYQTVVTGGGKDMFHISLKFLKSYPLSTFYH